MASSSSTMTASTLEPCHIISLDYPAFKANDQTNSEEYSENYGDFDHWHLFPPQDSDQRYEPKQLVHDIRNWGNTDRDNCAETSFVSVVPTTGKKYVDSLTNVECVDVAGFVAGVKQASKFTGRTKIFIDVFVTKNKDGKTTELLRIARETTWIWALPRRNVEVETESLVVPLSTGLLAVSGSGEIWVRDIYGLIHRTTDRAARHVRYRLIENKQKDIQYLWKPERLPQYEEVVDKIFQTLNKSSLFGKGCSKCHQDFNRVNRQPMELPCGHTTCRKCLVDHLNATGSLPGNAFCYACQDYLNIPQPWLGFLEHGAWNGNYIDDLRYGVFETFERSCADLDTDHRKGHDQVIDTWGSVLYGCWDQMVDCATEDEPLVSAPEHLQARNWPEFQLAHQAVQDLFRNWEDHHQATPPQLYKEVMDRIVKAFATKVVSGRLGKSLPDADREDLGTNLDKTFDLLMVRPGLKEFLHRLIWRTIRAHQRRECDAPECAPAEKGTWCSHGLRLFWTPALMQKKEKERNEMYPLAD